MMNPKLRLYKLLHKNIDTQDEGLYFFNEIQLANYYYYIQNPYWICGVSIPIDAQVCHYDDKSKADRLILHNCEKFDENNLDKYINFNDPVIAMETVKLNGWTLKHVKEQTPEICLAAVRQNGMALQFVHNQTPEICIAAIKQYSHASQLVKIKHPSICCKRQRFDRDDNDPATLRNQPN